MSPEFRVPGIPVTIGPGIIVTGVRLDPCAGSAGLCSTSPVFIQSVVNAVAAQPPANYGLPIAAAANKTVYETKKKPKPTPSTSLACGVIGGKLTCKQVPDTDLCLGAKQRLAAVAAIGAVDTAIVGIDGLIKQFSKGVLARLLAVEVAASQLDTLLYCK